MDFINSILGGSESNEYSTSSVAKSAAKVAAGRGLSSVFMQTGAGQAVGSSVYQGTRHVVDVFCNSEAGKRTVASVASGIAEKSVAGAAARSVCASAMKGNVITAGVGMAISSVGDTVDFLDGKISGTQYAKNLASNAAGVAGGTGGWAAGAAVGSAFGPVGTIIGGLIGGFLGSSGASKATKGLLD